MATKSNLKSIKPKKAKIKIGERELDFILDLNAFAEIEDNYGTINDLMDKIQIGSIKAIRCVIWAGLQNNENPPTEKQVGASIQFGEIENLSLIIAEAMGASLPEKEETDPNK